MKTIKSLVLFCLFLTLSCNDPGSSVDDSFETNPKTSGSTVTGICYSDQYAPAEENIIRKLDVLIVPDTSSSIIEERSAIADGFDYFINSLPEEVDFRIGVSLAHGPGSSHYGKLYQKGTEPLILDSELHTIDQIKADLRVKMQNPAGQGSTDGGEIGMLSLNEVLTNGLEDMRAEGFLRTDAALAVIFVSDEQDICAQFPEGVIPVPDPQGLEESSHENYCLDENGEFVVSPQILLDKIKEVQGERPFVVGGVIYNNSATMPMGGENEIGYGAKETVELAGGITVDLASGDYGDGLARLGKMAQVAVNPENEFNLKTSSVEQSTIEVLVDGSPVDFSYLPETNQVSLVEERGPFSVALVKYCEKEEAPMIASQIIAGGFHSCAVLIDGKVKCWGRNNFGQLGYGHVDNIGDDETLDLVEALPLTQKVVDLSAGMYHTCAVLEDGSVKCWGYNNFGQLGQGHTDILGDDESIETIASVPLLRPAKKIYSGTYYNCALLDNGNIQCWGANESGQLGYGHVDALGDDETLDALPYVNVGADVVQMDISTVSSHSCAALVGGDLKCWGVNDKGQLGYGHTNTLGDDEDVASIPAVPFGNTVLQLATGYNHTCALAGGQKIRCWGYNQVGQLGLGVVDIIGDNEAANSIGYIDLSGDGEDNFNMVASGNNHTCAVGVDNGVYCWGLGLVGATGHGITENIGDNETLTSANTKVNIEHQVTQVAGGYHHTCALTKEEGRVMCWGHNMFGQLGIGHTANVGDNEVPTELIQLVPAP